MAQVTLRDLTTNEDIVVPPEGYIFGRVGGDADIQLEDNSISRRQARVSLKGNMWLLEVLSVPQGSRAPRPVQLEEGATFAVGQSEFEVVQVEADDEPEADPGARTVAAKGTKPVAAAPAKKAPPAPNAKTAPAQAAPKRTATANEPAPEAEAEAKGVGAMFVAVPKGIAYYLLNVPKMLVNPFGTVRTAIEEQPAEPMGKIELIGYSLPALLATGMLGSIAGGIATLIAGGGFSVMAFIPIVPAISAVIGAVITGFVFHPLMTWVINKFLKGQSDARSRTNYFLVLMTLSILLAVPNAISVILSAVRLPFIGLVGLVLSVLATLISLYVTLQWFEYFKVVKWFKTVIMVLGALAVLGTAVSLVQSVIASVRGLGSGGSAEVADSELGDTPPSDPEEAAEWAKKKQAEAMAKVAAAQKQAEAAVDDPPEQPEGDEAPPPKTAKKDPPPADPVKKPEPKAEPKPEPVAAEATDTPPPPKEEPGPSMGYAAFARKRDAIEKLFENDPTVLARSAEYQKLYGAYLDVAFDLDKKWGKENSKKPDRARLHARLRDAELYNKTSKTIESLAGKLGVR